MINNYSISFFLVLISLTGFTQSRPPKSKESASLPPYVKTFGSIVDFFNKIETEFVRTAHNEEKDRILRQIQFMKRDMQEILDYKIDLFEQLKRPQSNPYVYYAVVFMRSDFNELRNRLAEIDNLCKSNYHNTIVDISKQLKTDLFEKEQNFNKIMKDVTGQNKYNKTRVEKEEAITLKFGERFITDIDILIKKMGGPLEDDDNQN